MFRRQCRRPLQGRQAVHGRQAFSGRNMTRHAVLFSVVTAVACLGVWRSQQESVDLPMSRERRRRMAGEGRRQQAAHPLPRHRFLIFFSGHQGSSALADMLASEPSVFIPGFEPLDFPGLTAAQKAAFMDAAFTFPTDEVQFAGWRQDMLRGKRIDRSRIASFDQLAGKAVSGFKMRPYTLDGDVNTHSTDGAAYSRLHTAASGLSPAALHALLDRYNVTIIVTLRQNRLKEALSWYKARVLGVHQFNNHTKAAAAAKAVAAARQPGSLPTEEPRTAALQQLGGKQKMPPPDDVLPAGGKVAINLTKLHGWLRYTDAVNSALQEAVAGCGRPALTVWYEDFLQDPLGEARRAAAFIGVQRGGSGVQLSAKYRKAGPDAVEDWVANHQELCNELQGTEYYQYLNASACNAHAAANKNGGSRDAVMQLSAADVEAGKNSTGNVRSKVSLAAPALPEGTGLLPKELLSNWCVPQDKHASKWASLSDAECMRRFLAVQHAAVEAVRQGNGTLVFKHVHKAGGSTLCKLAHLNLRAESAPLPLRKDWDTNCVPYEAFLGPHPAVGSGVTALALTAGNDSTTAPSRSLQTASWLGGTCWLAFLTPAQQRALPHHFRPLTFVASEGPLPDSVALDAPLAWVTMLRHPLDRVLSSYRWWQFMVQHMPQAPAECRAYDASTNATLEQWLEVYPDNWMTRELVGRSGLYQRRQLTESDLLVAQQRLHYFAAVLLLEEPEGSMALMKAVFGWRHVGWKESRAGSRHGSDAAAELDPATLQRLRQRNQFDLQLYSYAKALHMLQLQHWGVSSG